MFLLYVQIGKGHSSSMTVRCCLSQSLILDNGCDVSYHIKIITDRLSIHFTTRTSILSTRVIFIGKEPLMAFYSFQSIASYSAYNTYTLIYQSYYQRSTGIPIFKKRFVTFLSMCFRRVKTIFPVALKSSSGWFA